MNSMVMITYWLTEALEKAGEQSYALAVKVSQNFRNRRTRASAPEKPYIYASPIPEDCGGKSPLV